MDKDICRDFLKTGACRFEGKCKFKHPKDKAKTADKNICYDFARGFCDYGAKCRFSHPTVCKDFLAGHCKFQSCRFFHPDGPPTRGPTRGPSGPQLGPSGPGNLKRGMDTLDDIPPNFCYDFVLNGICRNSRCRLVHEVPNKRRREGPNDSYLEGPGAQGGPGPQRGAGPPAEAWNGNSGPTITAEVKAYVNQLELKVTMYEEKIRDLEKRCEQYEDFNKLLAERNDELKQKLGLGANTGNRNAAIGGGSGSYYPSSSRIGDAPSFY